MTNGDLCGQDKEIDVQPTGDGARRSARHASRGTNIQGRAASSDHGRARRGH